MTIQLMLNEIQQYILAQNFVFMLNFYINFTFRQILFMSECLWFITFIYALHLFQLLDNQLHKTYGQCFVL